MVWAAESTVASNGSYSSNLTTQEEEGASTGDNFRSGGEPRYVREQPAPFSSPSDSLGQRHVTTAPSDDEIEEIEFF